MCLSRLHARRLSRRRQQLPLQTRRQLGYAGGAGAGKKVQQEDKRHVLLTEDVAVALQDVSCAGVCCGGVLLSRCVPRAHAAAHWLRSTRFAAHRHGCVCVHRWASTCASRRTTSADAGCC
jgi:hypothetical protein